jgi:hypothetical protein
MTSESHGTHDQNILNDQANTTVSDELRKERGPEWCAIYDTMRQHKLTNMIFVGSDDPFCLVDLVSTIGTDISTGEEQLLILADEISLALDARRATADMTEVMVERAFMAANDAANGDPHLLASRKMIRAALLAALSQQAPE